MLVGMIRDAEHLEATLIRADICVIGAGAAGIAIAQEFLKDFTQTVAVLAGGGQAETLEEQKLSELATTELPLDTRSRVRGFGGTTAAWVGRWKPHDDIDFTKRSWIPFSGWPISRRELDLYYEQARRKLAKGFNAHREFPNRFFDSKDILTTIIPSLRSKYLHFGNLFKEAFASSKNVDVYLNAHATRIVSENGKVMRVLGKTTGGKDITIEAETFILACGAIENARILLISEIEGDAVGRYYMDHPKGNEGTITTSGHKAQRLENYTSEGNTIFGLRLSDDIQKEKEILNSHIVLMPVYRHKGRLARAGRKFFGYPNALEKITVRNHLEQTPNPENRVTLGTKKDAFGNPLPIVTWSISELDKQTIAALHEVLAQELKRLGLPPLASALLGKPTTWPITSDASHHMGTTRMGTDPKTSVVDANCKVHGAENLYVAGSSVFPTSGYANPTATIVALALRLAEHVRESGRKKRVLVIGTGGRAHDVIFPALFASANRYEITALYAKTPQTVSLPEHQFEMETVPTLDAVDFKSIDVIIIAIPPEAVAGVLAQLAAKDTKHCSVLLDTPVIPFSHLGAIRTHFKYVAVPEDLLGLPPILAARRHIEDGDIGTLTGVTFFQSGYKYHAIATLKRLTGTNHVRFISNQKLGGEAMIKHITMPGGVKAVVHEPRDYSKGRTLITGTEGMIADYDAGPNTTLVESPGSPKGMTKMKIEGYKHILRELGDTRSAYHYDPVDALYDAFCIKISQRLGFFFDIGWGDFSFFRSGIKLLSRVMPR